MKQLRTAVLISLMTSLCLGVGAAENGAAKRKPPIDFSPHSKFEVTTELRQQLLQFMLLRKKLLIPPVTCVLQPGGVCVVDVQVILLPDPADPTKQTEYCVALFPEVVHMPAPASSTNPEKTIVWSLLPPSPGPVVGPATFTFYDEPNHGIIILSDIKKQMRAGTLGDGTSPIDATKYLIKDKHKTTGDAVYLPIVVRIDNPGTSAEKKSVCGTPDPRITNDWSRRL